MATSCNQRQRVLPLREASKPRCWTCCTRSAVLQQDSGRPYLAGGSQATTLTCTTSSGGKVRGRSGGACSSNPARRSVKKRLRQNDTTSRRVSRQAAISSLDQPWEAYKIILALWT